MSQRVMLMEQQGDINPPLVNMHLDWTNLQGAYTSSQEIPSSSFLLFFFKNIKISLHISSFSNSCLWNLMSGQKSLLSPAAAGLEINFA